MKKKMERLDGELFRPLTEIEQRRSHGAFLTVPTVNVTLNPNPDHIRDGDY